MALFDFVKPVISVKKFEHNLAGQTGLSDQYLDILSLYDKNMQKPRGMEFFFYSRTRENAEGLKKDLGKIGYKVYGIEESEENQFSITRLISNLER